MIPPSDVGDACTIAITSVCVWQCCLSYHSRLSAATSGDDRSSLQTRGSGEPNSIYCNAKPSEVGPVRTRLKVRRWRWWPLAVVAADPPPSHARPPPRDRRVAAAVAALISHTDRQTDRQTRNERPAGGTTNCRPRYERAEKQNHARTQAQARARTPGRSVCATSQRAPRRARLRRQRRAAAAGRAPAIE